MLPAEDRQLLQFQAWLTRRLDELAEPPHARLLRQFALWHQLPRMRTKADHQPLTAPARTYAQLEFTHAAAFCTWLAGRDQSPRTLTQPELGRYYTGLKIGHRKSLRGFLNWAMTSKNLPTLVFARTRFATAESLSQTARIDLLRRLIADDGPLCGRVAAIVLLLYARPVTRILALTLSDIRIDDDGVMLLRLGDSAAPVPEPFAALIRQLAAQRRPAADCSPAAAPGNRSTTANSARTPRPRRAAPTRPRRPHPPTRTRGTRPRYRRRPRLPPHHHAPPEHQCRRHLDPLRRARASRRAPLAAMNTNELNTQASQYRERRARKFGLLSR